MSNPFASINGRIVPPEQATLPVSDLSVQRGYGVFDFFKVVGGAPIFLDDHLDRFFHSAGRMRLPLTRSRDELKALIAELTAKNNLADSGVRITLTGGCAADGYNIADPNLIITQRPLPSNPALASRGAKLITHEHCRQFPDVKTIDYLMGCWLQPEVARRGADDVLYRDSAGRISECPRSNFFLVTANGSVATPACDILAGVIRKHVLAVGRGRFRTEEREVTLDELPAAKEAFITSTTKGILPVVEIDGRPVGDACPGPVVRELSDLLAARIRLHARPD